MRESGDRKKKIGGKISPTRVKMCSFALNEVKNGPNRAKSLKFDKK